MFAAHHLLRMDTTDPIKNFFVMVFFHQVSRSSSILLSHNQITHSIPNYIILSQVNFIPASMIECILVPTDPSTLFKTTQRKPNKPSHLWYGSAYSVVNACKYNRHSLDLYNYPIRWDLWGIHELTFYPFLRIRIPPCTWGVIGPLRSISLAAWCSKFEWMNQ